MQERRAVADMQRRRALAARAYEQSCRPAQQYYASDGRACVPDTEPFEHWVNITSSRLDTILPRSTLVVEEATCMRFDIKVIPRVFGNTSEPGFSSEDIAVLWRSSTETPMNIASTTRTPDDMIDAALIHLDCLARGAGVRLWYIDIFELTHTIKTLDDNADPDDP